MTCAAPSGASPIIPKSKTGAVRTAICKSVTKDSLSHQGLLDWFTNQLPESAMVTVGAFEAKTHLAQLLKKVEKGETIVITKRGQAVAKLVPAAPAERDIRQLLQAMQEFQE